MPLKAGEIIKLLETDGWYLIATRGSHRQYKRPDKSDVSAGTLAGRETRQRAVAAARNEAAVIAFRLASADAWSSLL